MDNTSSLAREEHPHENSAHFLHSSVDSSSPRLPHAIAHRGFKGHYPENTLLAIEKAIEAGAHALELDLHISRDGAVVLSHDPSLLRCFGVKTKVKDCDWEYLKTLRTLKAPHEPMPREHIWVLLDIKVRFPHLTSNQMFPVILISNFSLQLSNDPSTIMDLIAKTIESVPMPATGPDWHKRVVLGCWSARYLSARAQYLPRYAMSLICIDVSYARQLLQVPGISFNINQKILMGPLGRGFLEEARAARRQVYVWTVNAPNMMRWCIRHGIDGVISDEPGLFREVCQQWEKEGTEGSVHPDPGIDRITLRQRFEILATALFVICFGWLLKRKYAAPVERMGFEQHKAK
ncbi:Glycerophosphoryl diester phosphodiesterase [Penicillium sp. DV-2018c]|nr:Glycerophosphoryl diester phosphodiesterase [Penicillium sp. DV-2018c]KAJ5571480.1 Glycerophosphoryl diester phosphodiesterase [Penicillium sp. DV-2018c]